MATILFYAPFNQRSRDTESLMIAFRHQGHHVMSLSQAKGLQIHPFLQENGIETHSYSISDGPGWWKHFRQINFLVRFCRSNRVNIIYSHLESANFIASVAQFFVSARVFLCRHHVDQYQLLGIDSDLSYKVTYTLARSIIVFSRAAQNYMINYEGIARKKIHQINLAYDFSLYQKIDPINVERLKKIIGGDIVLISVGSLNPLKRPDLSVEVLKLLLEKDYDVKLIFLGTGELNESLKSMTEEFDISGKVYFQGYVENVIEYLAASNFVLHPSISESSCVVVKEAGLVKTPVIVCKGVGDFDDYIVDEVNGYLVNQDTYIEESVKIIERDFQNKSKLEKMGTLLKDSVIKRFSIENVIHQYDLLNKVK